MQFGIDSMNTRKQGLRTTGVNSTYNRNRTKKNIAVTPTSPKPTLNTKPAVPEPELNSKPVTEPELKSKPAVPEPELNSKPVTEPELNSKPVTELNPPPDPTPDPTPVTEPSVTDAAAPSVTDAAAPSVTDAAAPSVTDAAAPSVTDAAAPSVTDAAAPSVTAAPIPSSGTMSNANATTPNDDCYIYPSLFGSADPACYVSQPLPEVQKLIMNVLSKKLNMLSSRGLIDGLIATGNEQLVDAVMSEALTPRQALLLKNVSEDPQVTEAAGELKDTLVQGINESIESVKESVFPPIQKAAGELATGVATSVVTAISDFPPIGAAISGLTGVKTAIDAVENAINIKNEFDTAIEPVEKAVATVGQLTNVINDAVKRAENAVPQVPQVQVPALPNATESQPQSSFPAATGGSRKRRHIHKLSRRIERTLRRVQKKFGLQDKNSFLRRTLRHRKT